MKKTPQATKERVIALAETIMTKGFVSENNPRVCIYWACAVGVALLENKIRGVVQAGSASWPFIEMENDDGISATNYSYVWDKNAGTCVVNVMTILHTVLMPELHAWVGIPETQEVIDPTTRFLKNNVKAAGFEWKRKQDPPQYFWDHKLPANTIYEVCPVATRYVLNLIKQIDSERIKSRLQVGAIPS